MIVQFLSIRFIKEWDKLSMWKQLGFPLEEATKVPEI
jgi:hypothetical protein